MRCAKTKGRPLGLGALLCAAFLGLSIPDVSAQGDTYKEPNIRALVDGLTEVETINRPAIVALPKIERLLADGRVDEAKAGFLSWCGERVRLACFRYEELRLDAEAPDDFAEARAFYAEACEASSTPACYRLGSLLDSTDGGDRKAQAARTAYLAACEGRHPDGCVMFADMMLASIGGSANRDEAGLLIRKACEVGSAIGCFYEGVFVEKDGQIAAALDLYDCSCRLGYARACLSSSIRSARAAAIDENFKAAYRHYAAACALSDGSSRGIACYRAGEFATFPENPDAGPERAQQFFQRACELEYSRACKRTNASSPSIQSTSDEIAINKKDERR